MPVFFRTKFPFCRPRNPQILRRTHKNSCSYRLDRVKAVGGMTNDQFLLPPDSREPSGSIRARLLWSGTVPGRLVVASEFCRFAPRLEDTIRCSKTHLFCHMRVRGGPGKPGDFAFGVLQNSSSLRFHGELQNSTGLKGRGEMKPRMDAVTWGRSGASARGPTNRAAGPEANRRSSAVPSRSSRTTEQSVRIAKQQKQ